MEKIGRYEVIGEIGKGAMGVVYKATDPNIGRVVAVKTLRLDAHGVESDELLRRFKNEARAAGVMNHHNIVTIYDAGDQGGMFYIAMEYIEGKTLQDELKQHKVLPVEQVIDVTRQVCAGLDYAHARGIIHRDIKPANIMIRPDGSVKIMDFGIAKQGGTGMTSTGQVVGTPNYMAPEQVKGRRVDGRADQFSVGVMIYEMLTGERPFTGESITTVIYKIVNETPAGPRDLDGAVHPGLSAPVMKALAKSPEERYVNCGELARDLENYKSYVPAPAPSATATAFPATATMTAVTAAAAAKPAAEPTAAPPSTVAAAPVPAVPAPAAKPAPAAAKPAAGKSGRWIVVAAAVVVLVIAAGLYRRAHRAAPPAPAPPSVVTPPAPPPAAPAETAEAKPAPEPSPEPAEENAATEPANQEPDKADLAKQVPIFGRLQIASSPPGASVTIDGRSDKKWVTPFAATRLKAGRHTVNFSLSGYLPETRQVDLFAGQKLPLQVTLQAAKATLAVSSNPPGGQILVDGHDTGQVTPAHISVTPGKHHIKVQKQGFTAQTTDAELAAGQVLDFAPALAAVPAPAVAQQPAPTPAPEPQRSGNPFRKIGRFFKGGGDEGVLEVRTTPKGAQVLMGEKQAAAKTPARIAVQPGTYLVTLKLPGYKPVERTVTIEKGKTMSIEEILEKQ